MARPPRWIATLRRRMPADASWPRLMSEAHPAAVGSYGADFVRWWKANPWDESAPTPRWWQELAAARILEHDSDGRLVWPVWLLTMARQSGKSVLLQGLALWRMERNAELFGEPAMVLHVANAIKTSREIQGPARAYARANREDGWKVREAAGNEQITHPNGSRWVCAAPGATFGFSASLAMVDEAHGIEADRVANSIEPTQLERESPQLGLISTAHPEATSLFIDRRREALTDGSGTLILEWSAPPGSAPGDRSAWRQASPHWTPQREQMLARTLATAQAPTGLLPGDTDPEVIWMSQYGNTWQDRFDASAVIEPGEELGSWMEGDSDDVEDWTFAVEDHAGLSTAVVAAGRTPDGRIIVQGYALPTRAAAIEWITTNAAREVIVGPMLVESGEAEELGRLLPVSAVTARDTRAGLALFRQLMKAGTVVYPPGCDELAAQVAGCRVKATSAGLTVVSPGRWDLIRAACWAVAAVDAERNYAPDIY